jgi:unspecific monooxygenase
MLERHFDLNHPDFIKNPYPLLEEFRETAPFFYDPAWKQVYVSRYDDIVFLLKDKRLGRAARNILSRDELGWPPPNPRLKAFSAFNNNQMLDNDPPRHTRMKALALKAFTPQRVESLRGKIEQVVNQLLDQVIDAGAMDFHHDVAEPLPVIVIAELLGVPEQDRHRLRPWSGAIVKCYELGYTDAQADAAERAVNEFSDYIRAMLRERRKHPTDDLISAMAQAEEHGMVFTEDELIANCILLLNAGHEATVNGSTAGLLALFRHPAQKALLVQAAQREGSESGALFRSAIEEMLRYDTPLPMFERYVLEDFEYKGHAFKRGDELGLIYASGNRDPRKFAQADVFDVTRKDNAHLTFGLGVHYCIGAPLARLEMQIAFQTLLRRCPNIAPTTAVTDYEYSGFIIRGIKSMPVRF